MLYATSTLQVSSKIWRLYLNSTRDAQKKHGALCYTTKPAQVCPAFTCPGKGKITKIVASLPKRSRFSRTIDFYFLWIIVTGCGHQLRFTTWGSLYFFQISMSYFPVTIWKIVVFVEFFLFFFERRNFLWRLDYYFRWKIIYSWFINIAYCLYSKMKEINSSKIINSLELEF